MGNGQIWIQLGLPGQARSIAPELKTKGIEAGKTDDIPWDKFIELKDPYGNNLSYHQK